ncbi:MAG: tetratricopeptide repeat protein, partial [Lewinella sp.]|nr:tetratricopeptide repeat protein [Lewinella sp.]
MGCLGQPAMQQKNVLPWLFWTLLLLLPLWLGQHRAVNYTELDRAFALLEEARQAEALTDGPEVVQAYELLLGLPPARPEVGKKLDSLRGVAAHLLGVWHYGQANYPAAKAAYLRAIHWRDKVLAPAHNEQAQSRYNLAVVLYSTGQMDSAEWLLQESNEIYGQLAQPDTLRWIRALNHLGKVNAHLGDRQLVLAATEQAVRLASTFYVDQAAELGKTFYHALDCLVQLDGRGRTIAYADSAIKYFQAAQLPDFLVLAYNARAAGSMEEQNYRAAVPALNRALALSKTVDVSSTGNAQADIYYNLALCQQQLGQYQEAKANCQRSIAEYQARKDTLSTALAYHLSGRLQSLAGQPQSAQTAFNHALALLEGPQLQLRHELLLPLANLLDDRAQHYERQGQLTLALTDYHRVFTLQDRIRQELSSEASQRYISEQLQPFFQRAIHLYYQLHQLDPSQKHYLWAALGLAERSKAFSLLNGLAR